jgi:hypothetical protein
VRAPLAVVALSVLTAAGVTTLARHHVVHARAAGTLSPAPSGSNVPHAEALDEMLRGAAGRERRWAHRPHLIVVTSVLHFGDGIRPDYIATAETISHRDASGLADDLSGGLNVLTATAFDTFASVRYEAAAAGDRVRVLRDGVIVVARFRGIAEGLGAVGYGGRLARADGSIASGTVMLDSTYDRTDGLRRLLRLHELGHALGYNHVTSQPSIMNPILGSEPTDFDRRVALIAFPAGRD